MKCASCGTENAEGISYCLNCGRSLAASEEDVLPLPPPEADEPPPVPEPEEPEPVPLPPEPPAHLPPPPVPAPPLPTWEDPTPPVPTPEPDPEPPTPQPTPPVPTPEPDPGPEAPTDAPDLPAPETPAPVTPLPEAPIRIEPSPERPAPMVPGPVPVPVPVPPVSGPPGGGRVLSAGWGSALGRALLAFVIVSLVAMLLAVYNAAASPGGESPMDIVRSGAFTMELFHHVGLSADLPTITIPQTPDSPFSGPVQAQITFAAALMMGTLLAGWLLFRAGKATADKAGGTTGARAIHGAKVALPYALLVFGVSLLATIDISLPPLPFFGGGPLGIAPSPVPAFLWPFGIALVFGIMGGLSSARDTLGASDRGRRVSGALAGAWRMTWLAMVLAFVGYLVVAALHPDDPYPFGPSFFREVFDEGILAEGGSLLLLMLMAVPNVAVLTLSAAAGGAMGFTGSFFGTAVSCNLVSYTTFPAGPSTVPDGLALDPCTQFGLAFDLAPMGYFAFLLVPLLATLLGGRFSARRAQVATRGQGAAAGAAAGVGFGLLAGFLMVLATISVSAAGDGALGGQSGAIAAGPTLPISALLALVWGVAGGALGGMLGAGAEVPRPVPAAAIPEPQDQGLFPEPVDVTPEPVPAAGPAPAGQPQPVTTAKAKKQKPPKQPKPPKPGKPPKARSGRISGFEPDAPPYGG